MVHLNVETHGDPQSPPLLLVHGFMSCNGQWLPNRDALAEHYHLVMAELWGHGDSPLPEDESAFSIATYIEEFERLRESIGANNWGVIGQSYAAGLMVNYAVSHPDRLDGIVVTNSRSAFGDFVKASKDKIPPPSVSKPASKPAPKPAREKTNNRHLKIHPIHSSRLPADVKDKLVAAADAMQPDAIRLGGTVGASLNSLPLLDKLGTEVLLTNGIHEKAFQQDVANLKAHHGHVKIVDMDGGHAVNIDAAEHFNEVVINFFKNR